MADLYIRNVPAGLYRRLKAQARSHGRSLRAEVIAILQRAVMLLRAGKRRKP